MTHYPFENNKQKSDYFKEAKVSRDAYEDLVAVTNKTFFGFTKASGPVSSFMRRKRVASAPLLFVVLLMASLHPDFAPFLKDYWH